MSAINRKISGIDDVHFRPLTKSKSAAIHTSHVTVTSINILSTDVKIIQPLSIHFYFQCNMQINNSHKSSPPGGTCQLKPKSFVLRTNSKRRTVSTFFLFLCFVWLPLSFSFLENDDDGLSKRQSSSRSAQQEGRVQLSSSTFSASSFFCTGCRTHVTRSDWYGPAHRDPAHVLDTDRTPVCHTDTHTR